MARAPIEVTKAYRVNDRRGQNSYGMRSSYSGSNTLYQAATATSDRKSLNALTSDTHRNLSNTGRKLLGTAGKWLYANFPLVASSVNEQANLSTEGFQPQFWGNDRAWGEAAENWLIEWNRICDVAGQNYDFNTLMFQACASYLREGDLGIILVENEDGYPMVQSIPSHRIDSPLGHTMVQGGPFDGSRIFDGVIVDDYRRPIGYRIYDDKSNAFTDVSANDMMLVYDPDWPDQVRGISRLASAVFDLQDVRESRLFELIAQKAASAIALVEENESGTADPASSVFATSATRSTTTGQIVTSPIEHLEGGLYKRFKANTGSKLSAFSYDRPGANVMAYQEAVLRDAVAGIDWSYWFSVDPTKVGGASMRVVVERINRTVRRRQRMLVKIARRIHGFAIAKAIKLGLLPTSDEWWKWEYQLAQEVTADKRYDSDVSIQEYNARLTTLSTECARRGQYWPDVQDQWLIEQKRFQQRAKELGVDLANIAVQEVTAEAISSQSQVSNDNTQQPEVAK